MKLTGWFPGGEVLIGSRAGVVIDFVVECNGFDLKQWRGCGSQADCKEELDLGEKPEHDEVCTHRHQVADLCSDCSFLRRQ
jgi:hypothetical protein